MTPQQEKYIRECEWVLGIIIGTWTECPSGPKAVLIDAMTNHIKSCKGEPVGPHIESPDKMAFIIGLTFADLMQLQNGGTIKTNPKTLGLIDMPITIFLGGTQEHMEKGIEKHPDCTHQFTESHGEQKN